VRNAATPISTALRTSPVLFLIWFVAKEPQVFEEFPEFGGQFPAATLNKLPKNRREFFSDYLPQAISKPPRI
jgi:hypothetical protein